jgi:hypothetical protein
MTDTTVDAASEAAVPLRKDDQPTILEQARWFAEAIGYIAMAYAVVWSAYGIGRDLFYDGAFNDGFEAGRASIQRACANPDKSLAVARGCPL